MRWGRLGPRPVAAVLLALSGLGISGSPADATDVLGCAPWGCVRGWLTVSNNQTSWDLELVDARADGYCAYVKVQIDLPLGGDPEYRSGNACPRGTRIPFWGGDQYAGTRGAALFVCRNDGVCNRIHYEPTR